MYKDDGVWWAEMDDANSGLRCTYSTDAVGFIDKVEAMAEYVDVYSDMIVFVSKDDAAKKFLNRARKAKKNRAESDEDVLSSVDEESASDTEQTSAESTASTPIEST